MAPKKDKNYSNAYKILGEKGSIPVLLLSKNTRRHRYDV